MLLQCVADSFLYILGTIYEHQERLQSSPLAHTICQTYFPTKLPDMQAISYSPQGNPIVQVCSPSPSFAVVAVRKPCQ